MGATTSEQVEGHIAAVRERIMTLETEARDLSLPAVSGDQNAVTSLASIRAQIQQTTADLAVLEDAKASAIGQEAEAAEIKAKDYRAHHMAIAQNRAAAIVKLAGHADNLLVEFKAVLADLAVTEREIWDALREASAPPSDSVVGRKNIGQFAIAALTAFANGTDRFRQDRPVVEWARMGWAHLLTDERVHDV